MLSLKRNSFGDLVKATGLRSRRSSVYVPKQTKLFKISQSKFSDFITCQRCFYLDRVKGLVSPSTPRWTLNETTDLLLKKEFDLCREKQIPHRMFEKYGLTNVVPFKHDDFNLWRDSLHHGLQFQVENSNIVLHGGVDDIWFDKSKQKLIIVDYKSQATGRSVTPASYLSGWYRNSYRIQLDFYAYLLVKMGFDVSPVGYFYVCNADRGALNFNGTMIFDETLVPYAWNTDWIDSKVWKMIDVLNSNCLPNFNPSCENCAYARQRARMEIIDA